MSNFQYHNGELHAESVALSAVATQYGTPCYIYSRRAIEQAFKAWDDALSGVPHLVCYAVKANSNLAVLNVLARLGAGFDIVSGGELERVLAAGGDPARVVFSGLGKTEEEIKEEVKEEIVEEKEEEKKEKKEEVIKIEALNSAPTALKDVSGKDKWMNLHGKDFWDYLAKHPEIKG